MRIAALLHVSFEKLGLIEDWALSKGHSVKEYYLFADPQLPKPAAFDMLIIMGGPMSVNDEGRFPWLRSEKALIQTCRDMGQPVLGICLGAQLLASSLGSRIYQAKTAEIGWFPVLMNADKRLTALFPGLPNEVITFHWHGETFDPPPGVISLGSSAVTACQGFLADNRMLALQFHPEIKPENISLMINHSGEELTGGPYIQDAGMLSAGLEHQQENQMLLEIFLNYLESQYLKESAHGKH
jgi:GMP synthase-like glutamine amidotransferase